MFVETISHNPQSVESRNPEILKLAGQLREGIHSASIPELDAITSNLAAEVYAEDPSRQPIEFYRRYGELTPFHISPAIEERLIFAIKGDDLAESAMAKRSLLFIRMGSVIRCSDKFMTGDLGMDSELLQAGIANYFERVAGYESPVVNRSVQNLIEEGVYEEIARTARIPSTWVRKAFWSSIAGAAQRRVQEKSTDQTRDLVIDLKRMFPNQTPNPDMEGYLQGLIDERDTKRDGEPITNDRQTIESVQLKVSLEQAIKHARLNPRQMQVLEMRFGLNGNKPMTLEEIGSAFDVTRERIRQLEVAALRKMRGSRYGRALAVFLKSQGGADGNVTGASDKPASMVRAEEMARIRRRNEAFLVALGLKEESIPEAVGQPESPLSLDLSSRPLEDRIWYTVGSSPELGITTGATIVGIVDADLQDDLSKAKVFDIVERHRGIERGKILLHIPDEGFAEEFKEYLKKKYSGSYYYQDGGFEKKYVEIAIDEELSLETIRDAYTRLISRGFSPMLVTTLQNALDLMLKPTRTQIRAKAAGGRRQRPGEL